MILLCQRAEEVGVFLKQAREEEKQLRRSFVSNYGQHFISTLFPELVERVPDVSVSCLLFCMFLITGFSPEFQIVL